MEIGLFIPLLIGCIVGTFTGLTPGIHINLVAVILLSSLEKFNSSPINFVVFIVSMSITHTFVDFIPSIFLGAPEEDSFLSILPGHQLLLEGRGYEAFIITLYGSIFAIPVILLFSPIFISFLPYIYTSIKLSIPFLLIFISLYIILRDKNVLLSIIIFFLSGSLGFISFNMPIKEPLLPLLSGLFGISSLIISIKTKTSPREQKVAKLKQITLTKKEFFRSAITSSIFAPLCSFLPGIGSSHAATFGSELVEQNNKGFLFMIGAVNTIIMGLSYVTLYSINKSRTGTSAAVSNLLGAISSSDLKIILLTIVVSGIIAFFISLDISKIFVRIINKLRYKLINMSIILIVILVNIIFTNWLGLIVLLTSTSLGIFTILSGSRRINLMACLILPSIIYYFMN